MPSVSWRRWGEADASPYESKVSWRYSESPETPTPTSLSAPGRSRSPRSSSAQASSAILSASSIGAASVVERLLIEKSEYRSFVVTVRRREPALDEALGDGGCHQSDLGIEERAIRDVPLERLLGRDRDPLRLLLEIARVDPERAVAQQRADRAGEDDP